MKFRGMSGTAMRLAKQGGSKRPRETDLRRAVSTNYYALFLFLCYLLADLQAEGSLPICHIFQFLMFPFRPRLA